MSAELAEVDIIILSYAKNEKLKQITQSGIDSLLLSEDSDKIKFNVVVIESNRQQAPYQYVNAVTIYPKTNFGFNKYLNIGIRSTSAPYVCISNNDVKFHKQWATEILKYLQADNEVMSASPICPIFHPKKGFHVNSGHYYGQNAGEEVAGWCIVFKRSLLNIIGMPDEKIKFWYADNDYANLLKKHHISHVLVSTAIVDHLVESTKLSIDHVTQHKYTDGSYIYYDYKWNHKHPGTYYYRLFMFTVYNKLKRIKFWLKTLNKTHG